MENDLLRYVMGILAAAGIPVMEEYPGYERPEFDTSRATVGLRELDAAAWTARFAVRIMSPRTLGGWSCQVCGAKAARALTAAGLVCGTEEMAYHSGSDCFCVTVEAVMMVVPQGDGWGPGTRWQVFCGNAQQTGVASFRAALDLRRRVVGTHWKSEPVGITSSSGAGGWKLELVQELETEPAPVTEPFVLTVRQGDHGHRYTGCCWNETEWEYTQSGARLIRRGFALGREEISDGSNG